MGQFVAKGDVVMVKPNIGWDRTPELAACTNPEVVKTLVELCLAAGAKKVIVMDNTTNQAQRCYARSGIAGRGQGGRARTCRSSTPRRIKKMAVKGEWLKDWDVIQDFVEVDKLINVPIAKHHSLCRVTLGHEELAGGASATRATSSTRSSTRPMVDLAALLQADADRARRLPDPRPERPAGRPAVGHQAA